MHPRERAGGGMGGGESLILKSAKKEKGVSVKKRGGGGSSRALPFVRRALLRESSECLFEAEITVFARRDREARRRRGRKLGGKERGRDSSIITSFHFDVLDVRRKNGRTAAHREEFSMGFLRD